MEVDISEISKVINGVFLHGKLTPDLSMDVPEGQMSIADAVNTIYGWLKESRRDGLVPLDEYELIHFIALNVRTGIEGKNQFVDVPYLAKAICARFGQPRRIKYPKKTEDEPFARTPSHFVFGYNQAIDDMVALNQPQHKQ